MLLVGIRWCNAMHLHLYSNWPRGASAGDHTSRGARRFPRRMCKAVGISGRPLKLICLTVCIWCLSAHRRCVTRSMQVGSGSVLPWVMIMPLARVCLQQHGPSCMCLIALETFKLCHRAHLNRQKGFWAPSGQGLLVSSQDVTCNSWGYKERQKYGPCDELAEYLYCRQTFWYSLSMILMLVRLLVVIWWARKARFCCKLQGGADAPQLCFHGTATLIGTLQKLPYTPRSHVSCLNCLWASQAGITTRRKFPGSSILR